jgi:acyl-CoA thioester hydrolase
MAIYLSSRKIIKEWIDYNNHMNVSYYLLIFDKYGADTLNNIFKMGEHSAKTTGKSTMIVESNITYNQELKVDDEVDINLIFFDHDKKRLQYKMEMIHKEKKYLASTIEILALYVDLYTRKVSEFEAEKVKIMDDYIKKNSPNFKSENLKFSNKLKKN